ncbi:kinase-like domain-containing protein [Lenzites betulinus]|nr:kinase-like domain-containing protein [Lenzites betulinus]
MSAPPRQTHHRILTQISIDHYEKATREGLFDLTSGEERWRDRHIFLEEHGYLMRPRYLPGWKPSWINTNYDPFYCEDYVTLLHHRVIDATRASDHAMVAIKSKIPRQSPELQIGQFLASIKDPRNHSVPVYEILTDPLDTAQALLVMPYLRPCNDPAFSAIGEIVEFVDQTIEGLVFMHDHNVAHRDIAYENVMMDARALYPNGHHPARLNFNPDAQTHAVPLPRAGRNIRYFYVDFGLSLRFQPGSSTLASGNVGRAHVPEVMSNETPYDALKTDIFALGELYSEEYAKYTNIEFLLPLITSMMQKSPERRPTAVQVSREWQNIRAALDDALLRWRLVPKKEQPLERVVNDTVAVAWEGVYRLKKMVSPES